MFVPTTLDSAHLDISVLGPPQICIGTEPITHFEYESVRALLVYLAVEARPHERSRLAYVLWPDASPKSSRQNLRQALAALRRVLKDKEQETPFLLATRKTLCLNPESDYRLDLTRFSTLLEEVGAHKHRRLDVCSACIERLEKAVALYRGDFAGSLYIDSAPFNDWLCHNREQLHTQAVRALSGLTDYYLAHNQLAAAIRTARRQLALHPLCDTAHHGLIQALAADGQRNAALKQCQRYETLLETEMRLELPEKTATLYRQLLSETWDSKSIYNSPPHNLPRSLTSLTGYREELAAIGERLSATDCRLLTLTGMVGVGKSRLALEAAWSETYNFKDGVYYVDMQGVQTAEALAAIATTLLPALDSSCSVMLQLTNWLRDKEVLLLLDHFDHLVHSDADSLRTLLREAPRLQMLITSRERLMAPGESFLELQGLTVPTLRERNGSQPGDALSFFVQSVRRWQPDFTLEMPADREAAVRLCQNTGGNPRALELCAYAATLFPLRQVIGEFEQIADWGELQSQTVPPHHRSMKAMFDCSWTALSPQEQQALLSLSLFESNFTMAAAQAITDIPPPVLLTLHAKSWLQAQRSPSLSTAEGQPFAPPTRHKIPTLFAHRLARMVRDPATADASGAGSQVAARMEQLRRAHAHYYMDYLHERVTGLLDASCRRSLLHAIHSEKENLKQARVWAIEHRDDEVLAQIERDLAHFHILSAGHRRTTPQQQKPFENALQIDQVEPVTL